MLGYSILILLCVSECVRAWAWEETLYWALRLEICLREYANPERLVNVLQTQPYMLVLMWW